MQAVPQKELSMMVDQESKKRLMEGLGEEEVHARARLMSHGLPQAGSWQTVAPMVALGLHLRPQEFLLAARYLLGMAVLDRRSTARPAPALPATGTVTSTASTA